MFQRVLSELLEWLVVFLASIPFLVVISNHASRNTWRRKSQSNKTAQKLKKSVDVSIASEVSVEEESSDQEILEDKSNRITQEVSPQNILGLPMDIQAVICSYTGVRTMSHISSASKACYKSIWNNPIPWSTIVLTLEFAPTQGALVQSLQDMVRRTLYGIDDFCRNSLSKHSRIIVRGDQCCLLKKAMRACTGISSQDGPDIADQVIGRCLELLVSFNVDETEARNHAKLLTSTISSRTDVFSPEQCQKVESAFSDAMDLHQLLSDVMLAPAESEMVLDDAFTPPFDADIWGEEGMTCASTTSPPVLGESGCRPSVDAALDRLIWVLRDGVDDEEAQPVIAQ